MSAVVDVVVLQQPASGEWTRKTLGWEPTGPGPIEDLKNMKLDH